MLNMHYFDIAVTHSVDFRGKIEFCKDYVKRSVVGLSEGVDTGDIFVRDRWIARGTENARILHNSSVTDYRQKYRHPYQPNSGKICSLYPKNFFYRMNSQVKSCFGKVWKRLIKKIFN